MTNKGSAQNENHSPNKPSQNASPSSPVYVTRSRLQSIKSIYYHIIDSPIFHSHFISVSIVLTIPLEFNLRIQLECNRFVYVVVSRQTGSSSITHHQAGAAAFQDGSQYRLHLWGQHFVCFLIRNLFLFFTWPSPAELLLFYTRSTSQSVQNITVDDDSKI